MSLLSTHHHVTIAMATMEQLLACDKCHERYKDPRKLLCGHTYCLSCLQDQDTAQTRLCVLCGEMWTVPASGAPPPHPLLSGTEHSF